MYQTYPTTTASTSSIPTCNAVSRSIVSGVGTNASELFGLARHREEFGGERTGIVGEETVCGTQFATVADRPTRHWVC